MGCVDRKDPTGFNVTPQSRLFDTRPNSFLTCTPSLDRTGFEFPGCQAQIKAAFTDRNLFFAWLPGFLSSLLTQTHFLGQL